MMEGRAGYFPLALEAAMTRMQESCTLPKGFYTRCLQTTRQGGGNYFTFNSQSPISGLMWCDVFYFKMLFILH